jgi:hypothetical protein
MERRERFLVIADIFQNVCLNCKLCGREFWDYNYCVDWSDLEDAIAEHERECLELPEEESNGSEDGNTEAEDSHSKLSEWGRTGRRICSEPT